MFPKSVSDKHTAYSFYGQISRLTAWGKNTYAIIQFTNDVFKISISYTSQMIYMVIIYKHFDQKHIYTIDL